jgi:hypothetical protein
VDGRLLLLIADGDDPGTLVLLEPIFGEVVAAVSADP